MNKSANLARPVAPGRIAVRKVGEHWIAFSTTRLPGWPVYLPGLWYNRLLLPSQRTLPHTLDLARKYAAAHRARLAAEHEIAEACS